MSLKPGFLIASPQMKDPWFERTVVLICQHDTDGAIGLVINRGGDVSVGAVIGRMDLGEPAHGATPTWWGGPVGPRTGFVVWRGHSDPDEGWNLGDEIAVSPSAERLTKLVASGAHFHLCLGYAGWGPGQLDGEITRGSWLYVELDAGIVFDTPMDDRYDRALALLGLTAEQVWMTPIDE